MGSQNQLQFTLLMTKNINFSCLENDFSLTHLPAKKEMVCMSIDQGVTKTY